MYGAGAKGQAHGCAPRQFIVNHQQEPPDKQHKLQGKKYKRSRIRLQLPLPHFLSNPVTPAATARKDVSTEVSEILARPQAFQGPQSGPHPRHRRGRNPARCTVLGSDLA